MGKRERKIEAIRKGIGNASNTWPAYTYGHVPRGLAISACNSYAGTIKPEEILGLIDVSITGNGTKGTIFTEYKIYYYNGYFGSDRGAISYQQIYESKSIPGVLLASFYNRNAMVELISQLSNIQGESLAGALDSINQDVQSFSDTIEKGMDLLDSISSLLDMFSDKD